MPVRRALNVIEYRITKEMDAKEFKKIESIMNGPQYQERMKLKAIPQTMDSGPIMAPDWWDDDDESSVMHYQQVAKQLAANK